MGNLLLSYFSPETLSWSGFVILGIALVGEAGAALASIISTREGLHKELAFSLAIAASLGYAIERVGDDAIVVELRTRAATAESQLKRFNPRDLSSSEQLSIADSIRPFRGLHFTGSVISGADDGCHFWGTLKGSLEKGGWVERPLAPNAMTMCDPPVGVPITADPGVVIRLHSSKEAILSPAASALQHALQTAHIKAALGKSLGDDPNETLNNDIVIVVGVRTPNE